MLKIFENRATASGAWQGLDAWQAPATQAPATQAPATQAPAAHPLEMVEPTLPQQTAGAPAGKKLTTNIKTIAFCGPSGGVGKTTMAINVAFELAAAGHRVALADLDVCSPNLLAALNQDPITAGLLGVKRLVEQSRFISADLERLLMVLNFDGVRLSILPGVPAPAEPADRQSLALVAEAVVPALAESFDFVVLDLPSMDAAPEVLESGLRICDANIAICSGDPVGVQRFFWLQQRLAKLKLQSEPQVVVNAVRDSVLGSNAKRQLADTFERVSQTEVIAFVPHDQSSFDLAMREGLPLSLAKKGSAARHAIAMFVRQGLLNQRTHLDWRVARNG